MITSYTPDSTHILEYYFRICKHQVGDDGFCSKCSKHIKSSEISDQEELEKSLTNSDRSGIYGGRYISALLRFITHYSEYIEIKSTKGVDWYNLCMVTYDKDPDYMNFYHSDTSHTFAYQVAWLFDILFRRLVTFGEDEEALRRYLNEF